MPLQIDEIIVWLIVGMLAGSLAGLVLKRRKSGYGHLANLGIGMAGAVIGGFIFNVLRIDMGLANISISAQDLVAAFLGALVFMGLVTFIRRRMASSKNIK